MGLLSSIFHSKSTEHPQGDVLLRLQVVENDHSHILRELASLGEAIQDLADNTRRRMDRYRARSQPRKDGKFAPQDASGSTNGPGDIAEYPALSHDQIRQLVREKGMQQ